MHALTAMKREHDAILRVLERLEQLITGWEVSGDLDLDAVRKLCLYLSLFADRHHLHGDARILFPLLRARGISPAFGPLAIVHCLQEESSWYVRSLVHAEKAVVRGQAGSIARFAENAAGCIDFLREAIKRENDTLIPLAEKVLTAEDLGRLEAAWRRHEARSLDPILREACDRILRDLDAPTLQSAPNPEAAANPRAVTPSRRRRKSATRTVRL